jgi:hypothetical protein
VAAYTLVCHEHSIEAAVGSGGERAPDRGIIFSANVPPLISSSVALCSYKIDSSRRISSPDNTAPKCRITAAGTTRTRIGSDPKCDSQSSEEHNYCHIHRIPHPAEKSRGHEAQCWLPRLDVSPGSAKTTNCNNSQGKSCCNEDRAKSQSGPKPKSLRRMKDGRNQSSARPSTNAANAIRGGGAITPEVSPNSFISVFPTMTDPHDPRNVHT